MWLQTRKVFYISIGNPYSMILSSAFSPTQYPTSNYVSLSSFSIAFLDISGANVPLTGFVSVSVTPTGSATLAGYPFTIT